MKSWKVRLGRVSNWMLSVLLGSLSVTAQAEQASLYITPQVTGNGITQNLLPNCTNETGGTFQAASVNVGAQVDFSIQIGSPAPQGGVTFTVTSTDSGVVAAIDPTSGGVPVLFIPENEFVTTTTFRIVGNSVGRADLNLNAAPSNFSFVAPVTGWDVGDAQKRFIDANPAGNHCRGSNTDPNLSTDPNTLATCGDDDIDAVATDGETPVLMRLKAGLPGEGCFEIISTGPPEQGRISADVVNTANAGGFDQAFSFYFPPDEFVDTGASRTVDVEFTYTPVLAGQRANTTRFSDTVTLVRPPVVLMHGLWADPATWSQGFITEVQGPNGISVVGDYATTNAEELARSVAEMEKRIKEAVDEARKQKIAATKADVVGHSMGGLLGRLHLSGTGYLKPENLNKGDIRRLITLNTPHFGTNLANLLIALHGNAATAQLVETDVREVVSLGQVVGQGGNITSGAICSMAQNSADLAQLSASVPSAHVFTATGGPAGTPTQPALFWDTAFVDLFEDRFTATRCVNGPVILGLCLGTRVNVYPQAVVDAFRFREANDLIVPLSSQLGGVATVSQAVTNSATLEHFSSGASQSIPRSQSSGQQVRTILDVETTSPTLTTLAGVMSLSNGVSIAPVPGQGAATDAAVYAAQCASGGPMNTLVSGSAAFLAAAQLLNTDVRIVSPTEGQVFAPGDTVTIVVELTDPSLVGGVSGGMDFIGGFSDEEAPYEIPVTIPPEASGVLNITANSYTYDGVNLTPQEASPVSIVVRRATPPASLNVPDSIWVRLPEPLLRSSERITVTGSYGGTDVNLSSSATGTTYTSSDTNVVTVDAEGVLTPVSHGRAVITTDNMGVTAFTQVRVTDPSGLPLPPQDISGQLTIQQGGIRLNRRTGFFTQRITVTNSASVPIAGPMSLVLSGLPAGVTAVNRDADTDVVVPGSAQFDIALDQSSSSLLPGAVVVFDVEFVNPNRERITYTPQIYVGRDL